MLKAEPLPPVIAPIVTAPADTRTRAGVLQQTTVENESHGPGTGGGAGTGTGTGLGPGDGSGIGPARAAAPAADRIARAAASRRRSCCAK